MCTNPKNYLIQKIIMIIKKRMYYIACIIKIAKNSPLKSYSKNTEGKI